jgi:hypothetical protein
MKLKKYELKKIKQILDESSKFELISQTNNPWNPIYTLNQEAQLPTNSMLND